MAEGQIFVICENKIIVFSPTKLRTFSIYKSFPDTLTSPELLTHPILTEYQIVNSPSQIVQTFRKYHSRNRVSTFSNIWQSKISDDSMIAK